MAKVYSTLFMVFLALTFGAGAGITASLLTTNALDNYANALLGNRGFTSVEPRKPNTDPADYQVAVKQVKDFQSRSLAVITNKSVDSQTPSRFLTTQDSLALGVVVSANGWILTTAADLAEISDPQTQAEVWVRNERFAISEVIEDQLTNYVLLKLTGANGLSPVGFGNSEDAQTGDVVFVINQPNGLVTTNIAQSEALILAEPQTAETYVTAWRLASSANLLGPVVSPAGELIGFAEEDVVEPLNHGRTFIQDIIRTGTSQHAVLGAYVIDLAHVYNLNLELRQGLATGALVLSSANHLAVPANTPGALAGLKTNDIITAVDGQAITATTSLSELLATYEPGQNARFSLLRAGAPLEITIPLGDDLIY